MLPTLPKQKHNAEATLQNGLYGEARMALDWSCGQRASPCIAMAATTGLRHHTQGLLKGKACGSASHRHCSDERLQSWVGRVPLSLLFSTFRDVSDGASDSSAGCAESQGMQEPSLVMQGCQ